MRLRIATVSTLPSSKVKASMMWRCSGPDCERKASVFRSGPAKNFT